ncbi:hypothetical protein P280DRAFT_201252 [Massarina eburnea CBS 473.64]|uniref:Uncharacterized protein n=1 Tax=Massarina eburnea CBS 473.64 TaxID=1395130 RepID=A0A6A6RIB7_9PLEO|nr:hypothetical protein P280DRAFT_201252 [Massarina eburnea CBS 473.64]
MLRNAIATSNDGSERTAPPPLTGQSPSSASSGEGRLPAVPSCLPAAVSCLPCPHRAFPALIVPSLPSSCLPCPKLSSGCRNSHRQLISASPPFVPRKPPVPLVKHVSRHERPARAEMPRSVLWNAVTQCASESP